jgi:GNAT superfamily N-acetyltransferase
MSGVEVVEVSSDHRDLAVATTSRAFWPDPLFGHFARDAVQEHRVLPVFLGALLDDALAHGTVHGAEFAGRLVGSASWLPPDALPRSRSRDLRIKYACFRALISCRNRRSGLALLDLIDEHHPEESHWYLALLGVDPRFQGRGIGGHLITPVLRRCDEEGTPAYLETQKPENLVFYERFGFMIRDELHHRGAPPMWTMWRDPDPSRIHPT